MRERIAATPAREQALAALERDYTVLSGHYAQSMNRQLEAQASAALARRHAGGRLRIVDPANLPLRRARPDRLAILLLGALLSVAAATVLSFALFYTDSSYKDPEELSHAYGSPVLVAIPRVDEDAGRWERQQSALGAAALACVAISMGVGGSVDVYDAAFLNRREGCACNASVRMRGANKMNSAYEALTRTESARGERRRNEQPSDDGRAARDEGAAGGVPPAPRYGAGPALIAGNDRYGAANDRILVLSARLQTLAVERDRHLFAATSALAGEGKSFVALNLAVSLAQNGMRVLLIDMDLRSPSLHWALRLSPPDGLLSYLRERIDFESSMQVTGLPGLTLIPAAAAPSAPELFACPRMRKFIAAARAAYARDYVVIDCPPALAAPETQIVARLADALVMVIAANRTPRHAVARALDQLAGCEIAGLVLNRFEPSYSRKAEYG